MNNIILDEEESQEKNLAPTDEGQLNASVENVEPENTVASDEILIPVEHLNKTPEELIREVTELKKVLGRQGQELGELRKKAKSEESAPRPQPVYTQQAAPAPIASTQAVNLDELYNEEWERNPKEAPKIYAQLLRERDRQESYLEQTRQIVSAASEGRIPGYEDFKELTPYMTQLADQYLPFIHPALQNHPKVLEALHLMARGAVLPERVKSAREEALSQKSKKMEEKKQIFTEDSSSVREETVNFKDLSFDQMNKFLGINPFVRKTIGD